MAHNSGDPPFVSIVVPTRNRAADLRICIDSLKAQRYPHDRVEIVVVDDGSTDAGATAATARAAGREVRLISETQRGSSAARNTGLAAARSDPVLFVDDDVFAPPDWLANMVDALTRHPDADAFAGRVTAAVEDDDKTTCEDHPLAASLDAGDEDRELTAAIGANMALRRRAIERAGPFDEWIAVGGADSEWFDRLHAAGGRVVYVAGAALLHRRSERRLNTAALLPAEFRRGAASHRYLLRRGDRDPWSRARASVDLLRHARRDHCAGALAQAARSAGLSYGLLRHWRTRPPDPPTVQR